MAGQIWNHPAEERIPDEKDPFALFTFANHTVTTRITREKTVMKCRMYKNAHAGGDYRNGHTSYGDT